jgi:hypothetical protein
MRWREERENIYREKMIIKSAIIYKNKKTLQPEERIST